MSIGGQTALASRLETICFVSGSVWVLDNVDQSQSFKEFRHEICLTANEKIFERDLLRVRKARNPLEEGTFQSPLEAD